MDFIVGLPRTSEYDSIWVIVDRQTKVAHFIPVKTMYSGVKLAELYMARIVCLHGVPKKIVSDRGSQFTSRHWKLHECCWGEGEDATLRSSLRLSRCAYGGRRTGEVYPSPYTLQDEGLRRRRPVPRPHLAVRPTWDSAHCNRPRTEKCVMGPICNSFSVMTVCNPPLWEYSGDSPGA
jgi:hypothetical protein